MNIYHIEIEQHGCYCLNSVVIANTEQDAIKALNLIDELQTVEIIYKLGDVSLPFPKDSKPYVIAEETL